MKAWMPLAVAIACEVSATLSLKAALETPGWFAVVVTGYIASFIFLAWALRLGAPLGVAYGIWAASGVFLTAILSAVIYQEPLTVVMAIGLALIVGGVLLVEVGSHRGAVAAQQSTEQGTAGSSVPHTKEVS